MTQSGFLGPQGTMRRRVLLRTYTTLFEGPLAATLAKIAARDAEVSEPEPPTPVRRNDGGPFNRLPRQLNAPSRSAPGLSSHRRSTAGPRPTTSVPGFAAAVLGARVTGVAKVAAPPADPTAAMPAQRVASRPEAVRTARFGALASRGGSAVREGWQWLAGARDWSADRRSQAVATGAAVLLLLALAAILIGKATALHPAGPPHTGGESPGPAQATVPGAVVATTRASSDPIISAASRPPSPHPSTPASAPPPSAAALGQLTAGVKTEDLSLTTYRVTITITNPSAITASDWKLEIQLPLLDLTVRNVAGAVMTRTGSHLVFTPVDTTRTLKPGTSAAVRFDVEGLGVRNEPFTCTIDSRNCTGIPG
jgi:hypothetical protein